MTTLSLVLIKYFLYLDQGLSSLGPTTFLTSANDYLHLHRLSSLVPTTVFTCTNRTVFICINDCRLHLYQRQFSLVSTTVFTCTNDCLHLYQRLSSLVPTTVFICTSDCLHLYQRQFSLVPTALCVHLCQRLPSLVPTTVLSSLVPDDDDLIEFLEISPTRTQ